MIEKFVQIYGAAARNSRNGQEAIEICKETKFDLILLHSTMPKLDDFDTTLEIVTSKTH